jgi:serine phosphatase RsbU (regulator of sigma subunit)
MRIDTFTCAGVSCACNSGARYGVIRSGAIAKGVRMSAMQQESSGQAGSVPPQDMLEIRRPDGSTTQMPLASGRLVVGRTAGAGIKLGSDRVSHQHAELFRDPFNRWWVRDLGSRNGTRVNGVRITERAIASGDCVEIGGFTLRLRRAVRDATLAGPETMGAVPVSDERTGTITTLGQLKAPMVAASHLSMLLAFGRRLLEIEEPRQRLESLCRLMAGGEFGGRWAAALRIEKGGDAPRFLCEPASRADGPGRAAYVSKTLLGAVRDRGQPVMASNLSSGPVDVQLSIAADVLAMSALACPLRTDGETLEILYVLLPPEFGTGEWLALASLAVEQLHQADAAWAARREAQTYAAIESELVRARQIQMRLVPREPRVPGLDVAIGFEPCRWVGGDYVDVVPASDGRTLLTVADTAGKGLQAALVASSVHSLVHAGVRAGLGLVDLMGSLNDYLLEYLPEDSFVTMAAVLLDPATGDCEVANAGHPAPLVLEPGGHMRWLMEATNMPLGIAPATFELQRERLGAGQMLALFTDGLTDLPLAAAGRLGTGRLAGLLRIAYAARGAGQAAQVAQALGAGLDGVRGDRLPDDDRTFLLVRRI